MIQTVLAQCQCNKCKPVSTPFPWGTKITLGDDLEVSDFCMSGLPYISLLGILMYIDQETRAKIAYSMGTLSYPHLY